MKSWYFLVGNYGQDPLRVFDYYFKHGTWAGNGYVEAGIIAVVLAVVGVAIFYYGIGRVSHKLSTLTTWVVTAVLVALLCFAVTDYNTGMSKPPKYGLQRALDYQWEHKAKSLDSESSQYKELEKCRRNHMLNFKKGVFNVKPVLNLCLGNSIIAMLLFMGLSYPARKGPTKYCQNIPFK